MNVRIVAYCALISMRFRTVRFFNGELNKEEREEGENGGLEKADEEFEEHKWNRREVGCKMRNDEEDDFAGENVAEKSERERDHTDKLADEFDDADHRVNR